MASRTKKTIPLRIHHRTIKRLTLALAALPLFQTLTCIPDLFGALNFELQSLIVNTLVNAVSIVVSNALRL